MSFDTINPPYNANDPHATFVNSSCFDFLLIELVPLANRMAAEVAAREEEWLNGGAQKSGLQARRESAVPAGQLQAGAGGAGAGAGAGVDEEEMRENVFWRLDGLGYRVGLGIVERYVGHLLEAVACTRGSLDCKA